MNISTLFIKRPVATTLLTVAITLLGILAFYFLPVSPFPQIDFPTIQVSATLPGAEPETMASSVTTPLERQFSRIAGVAEITSSSFRGTANIVLQFDLDRNIDGAARDVQAAINAARRYLPATLPHNPIYRKVNPADSPILVLALTSERVSRAEMYDAAATILQQKLSQVEGVGTTLVGGGSLPAVRVELNPQALNKYGIGLEEVRSFLSSTNQNRPKGQLADAIHAREITANDQLYQAKQYQDLVLAVRNGGPVHLADVGEVQDSLEDVRVEGLMNGQTAVMIVVFRSPGANIIDTVDSIRTALPLLQAAIPQDIKVSVVIDRSQPIRLALREVELTLVIAALLVILVVFAFLRKLRATAIPGVAVPVSIISTFGVMYLCGYSLDNLSLMALTIATGFVIDDAVVVLENISRHIEKGESPTQAAILGSREIAFTVLSMSVSLVAVFLPLLFMGGMVGRLFREFSMTLSAAVLVSLVLSLTTTPMMSALLLTPEKDLSHGWLYRASERGFDWLRRQYQTSLGWALGHPRIMLAVMLLTLVLNVALFYYIPKGFFPEQDSGRITGVIRASQDISFQAMRGKLIRILGMIRDDPDVEDVVGFTGGVSGGGAGSPTNTGQLFLSLKSFEERSASAREVIGRLRQKLATVPGAQTILQSVQDLRIGGMASAALYQFSLKGENVDDLNLWGPRVLQAMRALPQLADVNSDLQDKGLQTSVVIDRDTASRLGISAQLIDDTLYDAFGQRQVSVIYYPLIQHHVVMEVAPKYWQYPEILRELYVKSANGAEVPLSAFTRFRRANTPLSVKHLGAVPAVTISFNLAAGAALGEAVEAVEAAVNQLRLPAGIRGTFQGAAKAFKSSLANEPLLIILAILAVYIVLGILYESYIHPITILSTLPSAGVGALVALLLCGLDFSLLAIIGMILLIGIVKKNGILMVDFALQLERHEGKRPDEAILEACLLRFRPILMTTMAALLGALPMAIGTGVGSEVRRPLGISIVGGLIFSQMLTLYTTPVIYLYLDRLRLWFKRLRLRR